MAWEHEKSGGTILLDVFRNVLVLAGTGYVIFLLWRYNWILALVGIVPVYLILLNVFGFLTLPLYGLTRESRLLRKTEKALLNGKINEAETLTSQFVEEFRVNIPADTDAAPQVSAEPDPELQRLRAELDAARKAFTDSLERERLAKRDAQN